MYLFFVEITPGDKKYKTPVDSLIALKLCRTVNAIS